MDDAELGRLEALAAAAPLGPWELDGYCRCCGLSSETGICPNAHSVVTARGEILATENRHCGVGAFIAAAREAVPALCAEVRRLRADAARLVEALRSLYDEQNGPPLLGRHEKSWNAAMAAAKALLDEF